MKRLTVSEDPIHPTSRSMGDDFGELGKQTSPACAGINTKDKVGKKREFLKVYEQLPAQMLNVYGEAKYTKLNDEAVWKQLTVPQRSGAAWMTEYCSKEAERRGIAANRWLLVMQNYLQYQQDPIVKRNNEVLLEPTKCKELYEEIERILPSIEYCLAPKKVSEKTGAASLRSSVPGTDNTHSMKDPEQLDLHAKKLYEWLDKTKVSRIRMLATWQSAGGLSFVAGCHHRATVCFRHVGNMEHPEGGSEVSVTEWQEAIKARHRLGSQGIDSGASSQTDWA